MDRLTELRSLNMFWCDWETIKNDLLGKLAESQGPIRNGFLDKLTHLRDLKMSRCNREIDYGFLNKLQKPAYFWCLSIFLLNAENWFEPSWTYSSAEMVMFYLMNSLDFDLDLLRTNSKMVRLMLENDSEV